MYLVVSNSSEFGFLQHQNCLATSDHATLDFYFSLAVLGSIYDEFGFTNLRSYCSVCFLSKINIRDLILKEVSYVYL